MKFFTIAAAAMSLCLSVVNAGVVIIPIKQNQVVPKNSDDCYFGVTTPLGCGPLRSS